MKIKPKKAHTYVCGKNNDGVVVQFRIFESINDVRNSIV